MNIAQRWRDLGWRHPLWDYIRFFSVVQRQRREARERWMERLQNDGLMEIEATSDLPVPPEHVQLFFSYLDEREADFNHAVGCLRTEEQAVAFCANLGVTVNRVRTQNTEHHQSSAAMVGAVSYIAHTAALHHGTTAVIKPDRRCAWLANNQLHVTARNLDGAIPSLAQPRIVWEIKEYWGQTGGGSKMSDAVYECNLVGRELREFEERAGVHVQHVVFLDGSVQWSSRESDLRRFIDLFHQGLIDQLIVGTEVETDWEQLLNGWLTTNGRG